MRTKNNGKFSFDKENLVPNLKKRADESEKTLSPLTRLTKMNKRLPPLVSHKFKDLSPQYNLINFKKMKAHNKSLAQQWLFIIGESLKERVRNEKRKIF
jgi:hypothetical protein